MNAARAQWVVERARSLGFDLCGIAPVDDFPQLERLPEWLSRGYAGEMLYLHDARRASPARVLEGAHSLIVCGLNYNTPLPYSTEAPPGSPSPAQSWAEADLGGQGGTSPEPPRAGRSSPEITGSGKIGALALKDNGTLPRQHGSTPPGGQSFSSDMNTRDREGASAPEADAGPCGWISRYAWGDDYHDVLLAKLDALIAALRENIAEPFEARAYVDTGPVVERVAAYHAGLGWLAKNTCLINPDLGSWLFLGVIVTTLDLAPSLGPAEAPPPDLCGNCRLCIDACPTGAIVEPYVLDARRCISYLTIELRGSIPEELRAPTGRMVFGCDICQDVCPWNRKSHAGHAPISSVSAFHPRIVSPSLKSPSVELSCHSERSEESHPNSGLGSGAQQPSTTTEATLFAPALEWLASLSKDAFRRIFRGSALKRTKWRGLMRNACVALGNSSLRPGTPAHARITTLLERLAQLDDALIAEHARWASRKL